MIKGDLGSALNDLILARTQSESATQNLDDAHHAFVEAAWAGGDINERFTEGVFIKDGRVWLVEVDYDPKASVNVRQLGQRIFDLDQHCQTPPSVLDVLGDWNVAGMAKSAVKAVLNGELEAICDAVDDVISVATRETSSKSQLVAAAIEVAGEDLLEAYLDGSQCEMAEDGPDRAPPPDDVLSFDAFMAEHEKNEPCWHGV